ncbi:MAG: patatin-like phospholipase family protein [Bryobacterales bacterium]|nr:patatin-like phospholipase family protein [Bryobacterales bacterium]
MKIIGVLALAVLSSAQTIGTGTSIIVRTGEAIDAKKADGRVFNGVVDQNVLDGNGNVAVAKGAVAELMVKTAANKELTLDLESITMNGKRYAVTADESSLSATQRDGIGKNRRTVEYLGGGAAVGAIIDAIAGGGRGAAIGAAAGAGAGAGAQVFTRGKAVKVPAARPKIGLVLAGGAAVGLTHIGVIRWLEDHRIPVDYIAGTSMGGLVGGLYATGHDATQMAEFAAGIDWSAALRINPPFEDLAFRRKQDRRQFPVAVEAGWKGGLRLPMGLSPGHGIGLVISRATASYEDLRSFQELPIPFRCVAVDLVTGREVIFAKGPLFDALRATMSIPGVFAPLQLGDQVLVDGGILNNLPIDVVKAMGAEVIIAVGLETPESENGYDNLLAVIRRSLGIMVSASEHRHRKSMRQADLILLPDLTGFSSGDYSRAKELADRGYEGAKRKGRFLATLAVDEAEWATYLADRNSRRRAAWIRPQFIDINGFAFDRKKRLAREMERELALSSIAANWSMH